MDSKNSHNKRFPAFIIIRYAIITGIHLSILYLLLYLDHHFILSENVLSILVIPVGLINCAVILTGFMRLKGFTKAGLLYFAVALINFICYIMISLAMHSQAGPVTN